MEQEQRPKKKKTTQEGGKERGGKVGFPFPGKNLVKRKNEQMLLKLDPSRGGTKKSWEGRGSLGGKRRGD